MDQGEWITDQDGQWTWVKVDGSRWRQDSAQQWYELDGNAQPGPSQNHADLQVDSIVQPPHPGPPPRALTNPSTLATGFAGAGIEGSSTDFSNVSGAYAQDHIHQFEFPGEDHTLAHGHEHDHEGALHHGILHEENEGEFRKEINPLAIWSAFLGFLCFFYVGSVFAIILGLEARHQIKHHHSTQRGSVVAYIGIVTAIIWLCTIPVLIGIGINFYHGARTTYQDTKTKEVLNAAYTGINDIFKANKDYGSINSTNLPSIPLVHFQSTCGTSGICMVTGNGFGYSYVEMCQVSGSGHAWMIASTSMESPWYGETSKSCPTLGDPGSASGQPTQLGSWHQGGFPPVTLDFSILGNPIHLKL